MPGPSLTTTKKTPGPDPQKIAEIERTVRASMPAAFNQIDDLENSRYALYRWDKTERGIQYLIDHGHTFGNTIDKVRSGTDSSLRDVVMLGHAGLTFGGGACNDYSAAGMLEYMRSDQPYPISRFWAPGMGHSFDVVGDTRMSGAMVLDPWLTERSPMPFWETALPQEGLEVINEWAPRQRGEGGILSRYYITPVDDKEFRSSAVSVDILKSVERQNRLLQRYRAAETPEERRAFHLYRHPTHRTVRFWDNMENWLRLDWMGSTSVPFWDISRSRVLRRPVDLDLYR